MGESARARLPVVLVALAAATWLAVIALAPVATQSTASWGTSLAELVRAAAATVCHQRPERSFALLGTPFIVCARCLGGYVGVAAGLGYAAALEPTVTSSASFRRLLLVAALPSLITYIVEAADVADPGNWGRSVAALPVGTAAGWIMGAGLRAVGRDPTR